MAYLSSRQIPRLLNVVCVWKQGIFKVLAKSEHGRRVNNFLLNAYRSLIGWVPNLLIICWMLWQRVLRFVILRIKIKWCKINARGSSNHHGRNECLSRNVHKYVVVLLRRCCENLIRFFSSTRKEFSPFAMFLRKRTENCAFSVKDVLTSRCSAK